MTDGLEEAWAPDIHRTGEGLTETKSQPGGRQPEPGPTKLPLSFTHSGACPAATVWEAVEGVGRVQKKPALQQGQSNIQAED